MDPNTTNDADLDEALALLQEQKPLVRVYTTDDIGVLSTGDAWVSHAWGSDVYQVVPERPTVKFYIPEEGGIRGSDTAVMLANAKHPIAASCSSTTCSTRRSAAENTNYIGYMGPNAAAKQFIDPAILDDPTVNPDQAVVDSLVELLDLGADLDEVRHPLDDAPRRCVAASAPARSSSRASSGWSCSSSCRWRSSSSSASARRTGSAASQFDRRPSTTTRPRCRRRSCRRSGTRSATRR